MQVVVREEQLSLSSRAGAGMAGLSFKAHLVRDGGSPSAEPMTSLRQVHGPLREHPIFVHKSALKCA